jgi:predicted AAA+ superfamily ATPase
MRFIDRQLSVPIKRNLNKYPILTITGPRQSGKTTLLKNVIPDYRYVSLENTDQRNFAMDDPLGFLKKYDDKVIFDEVQRVPHLFSYLQTAVDESGKLGQYVLSGSQNFHLMERITQSLAGRVAIFKLLPFDFSELDRVDLLPTSWQESLIKGFYPAIYDRKLNPSEYYSNYVQTYINRDVTSLTKVHDIKRFNTFISLCAGRAGQLLNLNALGNECGITQPTAKSWLSLLESSYIIFLLPPYFENFNKRIVKSPKLYFYDTGLLSFLMGLRKEEDIGDQTLKGALFENLVIANLYKLNYHQYNLFDYWFWRDSNGNEIDLLKKINGSLEISEIKATQTVLPRLMKGLDHFDKISQGKVKSKTLIYGGNENQDRSEYLIRSWKWTDR